MAITVSQEGLDCCSCQQDQKDERGCERDSPIPGRWEIEGEKYQRCPVKLITNTSIEYLQAFRMFKNGFLPNGVGWCGESSKFIYAMQIIEQYASKDVDYGRQ